MVLIDENGIQRQIYEMYGYQTKQTWIVKEAEIRNFGGKMR